MVFYSRYYIAETLFVFFTFAAWTCGWRAYRSGRLVWYLACGACLGMMQATKETSVIVFAAMAGAGLGSAMWRWAFPATSPRGTGTLNGRYLVLAGATALAVAAIWLSSFGRNLRGPLDGLLTYLPWLDRAVGHSPHVHPWYYYLSLLGFSRAADGPCWSEGLILGLAVVGGLVVLGPRGPRVVTEIGQSPARWVAFCTLLLTAAYAAIPYKTPWCLLGFLHGMILLAGVGAVALVRFVPSAPLKAITALALVAATGHLAWQAYRASYVLPSDPKNPYAYVQSTPDIERLAQDVATIAAAAPQLYNVGVAVVWEDAYYWPLPWYLRRFSQVGYWNGLPADPAVPLLIASPRYDADLTRQLDATHLMTGYYAVRPNVLAQLWVRMDLWEAHLRRQGRL